MKKSFLCAGVFAVALVFNAMAALAGDVHNFKVRYSLGGLSKQIIVPAESSFDARRTVQSLFPEAIVYSATEVH